MARPARLASPPSSSWGVIASISFTCSVERLADGGRRLSGLLGQRLHALLHLLAQAVEVGRGLLRRLVHAARGGVELAAHLLELAPDLGDDLLEAALEIGDRAGGMRLRLLAKPLDLGERRLRLACGIAGERRAHLLGPLSPHAPCAFSIMPA